jgi:hypothetical protein
VKAKPTTYAQVEFRSRLEARWATFFDLLNLEWEYEPERTRVEGVYYQPDFLVCNLPFIVPTKGKKRRVWVIDGQQVLEVKPADKDLSTKEMQKIRAYVYNTNWNGLIVLRGAPGAVEATHYKLHDGDVEATRVQFGTWCDTVGLYCLWTQRGDDLQKPWQAQPQLAQTVFENCFLGRVGDARKAVTRTRF